MTDLSEAAAQMFAETEATAEVSVADLDQLVSDIQAVKGELEKIDVQYTEQQKKYKELLYKGEQMLDGLGRKSYQVPGIGTITKVVDNSYKMPEGLSERLQLFEYIQNKYGRDALLGYQSINHQTLNRFVKDETGMGDKVPGLAAPGVSSYAKFVGARR